MALTTLPLLKKKKKDLDPVIKIEDVAPVQPQPKPEMQEQPPQQEKAPISENSQIGIKFNKDGSTIVTTKGGTSETLSKDEYKRYTEQRGINPKGSKDISKPTSEKVQRLLQAEAFNRLYRQLKEGNTKSLLGTSDIVSQMQQNQELQTSQNLLGELPEYTGPKYNALNPEITQSLDKKGVGPQSFLNPFSLVKNRKEISRTFLDVASNLVTIGKLGLGSKDTQKVKIMKENLAITKGVIEDDISLIASGRGDYEQLQKDVEDYKRIILYLDSQNKRVGLDNLAYWVTDGRNLGQELETYRRDFANLAIKLAEARLKSQALQEQELLMQQFQNPQ